MTQFVVIGGVPRSGTNLTRRIVGSHSKIAIPPAEFQFFNQHNKGKSIKEILANKRLAQWGVDFSDLYTRSPEEVYVETLRRYTNIVNKEIPGEKSPLNEFFYPLIQSWLSEFDLRFIHLVRNPFDVMASYKFAPFRGHNRGKTDLGRTFSQAINWRRSVSLGLARVAVDQVRYYLLKYEDLTSNPALMTQALCNFIGVDYEEANMLTLADFSTHRDNTSFPKENEQTSDSPVIYQTEDRKSRLTKAEVEIISAECGELAQAMGYMDSDLAALPPTERQNQIGYFFKKVLKRLH